MSKQDKKGSGLIAKISAIVAIIVSLTLIITNMLGWWSKCTPQPNPSPTITPLPTATKEPLTLSGYVKDSVTGTIIPNVEVSLPELALNTITDSHGFYKFIIEEGKENSVKVMVNAQGYKAYDATASAGKNLYNILLTPVARPQPVIPVVKQVETKTSLQGFIIEKGGKAVSGVTVTLMEYSQSVITGSDGIFLFSNIKGEAYTPVTIRSTKEGYETDQRMASLGTNGTSFVMKKSQ